MSLRPVFWIGLEGGAKRSRIVQRKICTDTTLLDIVFSGYSAAFADYIRGPQRNVGGLCLRSSPPTTRLVRHCLLESVPPRADACPSALCLPFQGKARTTILTEKAVRGQICIADSVSCLPVCVVSVYPRVGFD